MHITARCHPALRPLLPDPKPAGQALPDWLRDMPSEVASDLLGDVPLRTLKHCAPMIDALRQGVLIFLPTDVTVAHGRLSWDWDPPALPDTAITRAPVGLHLPDQARGAPIGAAPGQLVLKFINFWTLQTAPGWSLMVHHPVGYPDLPFTTLSGVVDCDLFSDGYVHFPALLRAGWEGVIRRGTPVAQITPVQRQTDLTVAEMTPDEIAANTARQEALQSEPGHYRKHHRR